MAVALLHCTALGKPNSYAGRKHTTAIHHLRFDKAAAAAGGGCQGLHMGKPVFCPLGGDSRC
eukprot:CAMPEP_0171098732 /NCGR_PEP_ID=MMETSP0766_2-20121228/49231_1 /TAXON_ID=439317 /ORGANISM="Gambierdiscus australes, Strain CAWD 149" /LENGTH=61 /DNA_ID=CAMNT_0011558149 /DNA_START=100 /DNA_END=285 /DNA_ORIENTATION=+